MADQAIDDGSWWGDPLSGIDTLPGSTTTDTYDIPGLDPTNPGYPGDPGAPTNLYPDAPPPATGAPASGAPASGATTNTGGVLGSLGSLFGGSSGLANLGVYGGIGALGMYEAGKARDETKQYGQTLQAEGQPFYDAATGALQRYQTGTLLPWQSAQIQDFITSSDQQVKQLLSQNGMVDSSVLATQTQQIQRQAMEMTGQFIDQSMKDSIALLGASQPFLMGAVNTAMQADQQYASTVQQFLGSLAQAYAYQAAGQAGSKGNSAGGGGILGAAGGLLGQGGSTVANWLKGLVGGGGSPSAQGGAAGDIAGDIAGIGIGKGLSSATGTPPGASVSAEPIDGVATPAAVAPIGLAAEAYSALGSGVPSITVEGLTSGGEVAGGATTALTNAGAAPEASGVLQAASTSEAIGNAIATGGPIAVAALIAYGFADAIGKWTAGNPQGNVTRDWNQMLGGATPDNVYQWLHDGVDAKQFTQAQADQMWAGIQRDAAADPNYWSTLTQHMQQSTDAVINATSQWGPYAGQSMNPIAGGGTTEPNVPTGSPWPMVGQLPPQAVDVPQPTPFDIGQPDFDINSISNFYGKPA
jgi:hypothetical protein